MTFLTKPIDPTYLKLVMDRALKKRGLQDEVLSLRQQLKGRTYSFHSIISKNPKMHSIFRADPAHHRDQDARS